MLNEQRLKTLNLFSYYVRSHGISECDMDIDLYDCTIDWFPGKWYSEHSSYAIESYDAIDEVIRYIIDSLNYDEIFDSCERGQRITVNFDAKERKIKITAMEEVFGQNELGTEITKEDYEGFNGVEDFMETLRLDGIKQGQVNFDGGGDSGQIESYLETSQTNIDIPAGVEDFLYAELSNFYGGWEINEGSHGSFIFFPQKSQINLHFYEHTQDWVDKGQIYYLEF